MTPKRRKLFALRDEVGLDPGELLELAEVILWREGITSTNDLDENDVGRLLDALDGYIKIGHLLQR